MKETATSRPDRSTGEACSSAPPRAWATDAAHDLHNLLAVIMNYTTLAREAMAASRERTYLDKVLAAGAKARDLARQIEHYSRSGEGRGEAPVPGASAGQCQGSVRVVPGPEARSGEEWILLVEDEPAVADSTRRLLERLGYRVELCPGSESALAAFHARPGDFAAAVTDVRMPGMDGWELTGRLHAIQPALPVLLLSGAADAARKNPAASNGRTWLLEKPVAFGLLARTLERMVRTAA